MKLFLTKENHEKLLKAIDDHIERDLKYKFEKMKALKNVQIVQKNASNYESMDISVADIIRVKEKKHVLFGFCKQEIYNLEEDFCIRIGFSCIGNEKLPKLAKIREDLVTYLLFAECMVKYRIEVETQTDFEFDYDKLIQFIHLVHFYLATQKEENPNSLDYRRLVNENSYRIDDLLGVNITSAIVVDAYDDYYFDSDSIKEGNTHYFISVPSIQDDFIRFNIEFNEEEKEVLTDILSSVRLIRFPLNASLRNLYLIKSARREYLDITVRNKEILYIRLDNEHAESSLHTFNLNNIHARTVSNGNTQTHPLPLLRISNDTTEINICCTMDEFEYMIS